MITAKQREEVRAEIAACCRQMMLSRRIVELCEQEATPKQEEFLHRVLTEEVAAREKSRRQTPAVTTLFQMCATLGYVIPVEVYFGNTHEKVIA